MTNNVRMQPDDICVPAEDPFRHDLLDRKEPITILTNIISKIDGPCVLAIDAPWGEGKSTFIKIWNRYLDEEGFRVVNFSAWDTDFAADPFIALSEEILEALERHKEGSDKLRTTMGKVGEAMMKVAIGSVPGLVSLGTGGALNVSPAIETFLQNETSPYLQARKAMSEFRSDLEDMARSLAKSKGGRPLVVVIDELDRCRPTYAAKLLEVAKHLFAVDNIVFVLAVNREELEHSICRLYGDKFDAKEYLHRFFDFDFQLPEPELSGFIEAKLEKSGIDGFFRNTEQVNARESYPRLKEMLFSFFDAYDISLRTVSQSLHRLGLTLVSLPNSQQPLGLELVVALIIRTVDIELYRELRRGTVTDEKIADKVFKRPGAVAIRDRFDGMLFESILIVGMKRMAASDDVPTAEQSSPLLDRYEALLAKSEEDNIQDQDRARAQYIVDAVKELSPSQVLVGRTSRFGDAIQRLELVSPDFLAEES